jgi:hypothetical protein
MFSLTAARFYPEACGPRFSTAGSCGISSRFLDRGALPGKKKGFFWFLSPKSRRSFTRRGFRSPRMRLMTGVD